ncbi:MAG: TRZ/ATZ family hydrolase [Burkholderiales bacterium]|nr:TRZ/ATZ family hydrolase [Burkholderiales bacterium]
MTDPTRPLPADCLIAPRWVLPVAPDAAAVLEDHAVVVTGGRIEAVAPLAEAEHRWAPAARLDLPDHALIPGLVNAHTHAAMTLLRGLADDLPLMRWLQEHIWPAEAKHVDATFVHDGTLLAAAELLRGGVTCFNDMYFFPEAAGQAAITAGIRAALGIIAIEFPTAYASDAQDYLDKGLATRDALRHAPRLHFCLAPHAPYTVSDRTFARIGVLSEQLGLPIHVHLHETAAEVADAFRDHGARPLARLDGLGLLGPQLVAVHAVHVDTREIALLARHGSYVVHCPTSNLKLASGVAPVPAMLDAGVNVALGTDGAASHNRLDLFAEMRMAALLAKGIGGRADALPAAQALQMATLAGARALGLDAEIGSIEPGKCADLVAVDLGRLESRPVYDPLSHLVYVADRRDVTHVWVDGEPRVLDRRLTGLDADAIAGAAERWRATIVATRSP